jgi:chromosome segregation ATPase
LDETSALSEENQQIKNALHSFTLESKDLVSSINQLEDENDSLKQNIREAPAATTSRPTKGEAAPEVKKIQAELSDLKKQYAELEERYLELKLS